MSDSKDRSYLGIDVSKGYADFCLMGEDGTVWEETVLDDTDRGHRALRELLQQALTRSESLEVGLEATGGYERNWLQTLREWGKSRPVETDLVNALAVKRFAQQDLHGNKTDGISAQRIASYLRKGLRKTEVQFEPRMEGPKAAGPNDPRDDQAPCLLEEPLSAAPDSGKPGVGSVLPEPPSEVALEAGGSPSDCS